MLAAWRDPSLFQKPYVALLLMPTGIGCSVGGYAGDGLPIARALAAAVDILITHPNVLNGASLFWPLPNTLYVEGYGLDQFCQGAWGLRRVRQNRLGVVVDSAIEADLWLRQQQVIQAAQATLGLTIHACQTTDQPLQISLGQAPSGASYGRLQHPSSLLGAARQLVAGGCEALALVARFPDDLDFTDYQQAAGVDPLAGVEAILSHLVVRELGIPAAHAPVLRVSDPPTPVHPRAAAEEVGFTFLPSVLAGLSYAPQFVLPHQLSLPTDLQAGHIDVVVAPATAFGSPGLLALVNRSNPPLLMAVEENTTTMRVHPADLGIPFQWVRSYWEVIGRIVAHRAGISFWDDASLS
ncbi:MAG: DUF3326 domain-containing protein [Cyanobacteriota bacterium]|nr:DUF3326 domain-containing protein [Cyanobacteriota bacterium]